MTIVEGQRRSSKKEFLHFLEISAVSLLETEAAWELCLELNFISKNDYDEVESKILEVSYLMNRFIQGIKLTQKIP